MEFDIENVADVSSHFHMLLRCENAYFFVIGVELPLLAPTLMLQQEACPHHIRMPITCFLHCLNVRIKMLLILTQELTEVGVFFIVSCIFDDAPSDAFESYRNLTPKSFSELNA